MIIAAFEILTKSKQLRINEAILYDLRYIPTKKRLSQLSPTGKGKKRKRNGGSGMAETEQRVKRGKEGKTRKKGFSLRMA